MTNEIAAIPRAASVAGRGDGSRYAEHTGNNVTGAELPQDPAVEIGVTKRSIRVRREETRCLLGSLPPWLFD